MIQVEESWLDENHRIFTVDERQVRTLVVPTPLFQFYFGTDDECDVYERICEYIENHRGEFEHFMDVRPE